MSVILLLAIPSIIAPSPHDTQVNVGGQGLDLDFQKLEDVQVNTNINVSVFVFNTSNGFPMTDVSCEYYLFDDNGNRESRDFMTQSHYNHYSKLIDTENLTSGDYTLHTFCNNSQVGGFASTPFEITPNGESPQTGVAIFYIGFLALLIFGLIFITYFGVVSDQLFIKATSWGGGYLLLMAISFIAWQMASDFLISSPFLVQFLRILFLPEP